MAQVVLANLSKVFPDAYGVPAVNTLSLSIEPGELLVLVGPSGCGKTTTLRMIAGLEEISQGTVTIDGQIVNKLPPKDRDVAMVFQNYALFPHLSVFENMALGLKLRKVSKSETQRRVHEAAEVLGLTPSLDRKPSALSGGERQRVAVGRAIVRQPKLFLFDEPLSNLDPPLRAQMRREISKLHTRLGATIIYVTHDQVEAMTLGERVAVMRDGIIQQVAEPMVLYNQPANLFVAQFIGSPPMNCFEGELIRKEGRLWFVICDLRFAICDLAEPRLSSYMGKQILMGLRPENITAEGPVRTANSFGQNAPPAPGANTFQAKVELVEPLGWETHLHLSLGQHFFVARVPSAGRVQAGQGLSVTFDMDKAHFFDPKSTLAIR